MSPEDGHEESVQQQEAAEAPAVKSPVSGRALRVALGMLAATLIAYPYLRGIWTPPQPPTPAAADASLPKSTLGKPLTAADARFTSQNAVTYGGAEDNRITG